MTSRAGVLVPGGGHISHILKTLYFFKRERERDRERDRERERERERENEIEYDKFC